MVKNYWYIIALGAVVSVITQSTSNYLVFAIFVLWLIYLLLNKKLLMPTILAITSFFFFYFYIPSPDYFHKANLENDQLKQLTGKIVSSVMVTNKKIEFTFEEEIGNDQILVIHFPNENEVNEKKMATIQYGSMCKMTGILTEPERARNPHQFDYRMFLLQKGISQQFILSTLDDIHCVENQSFLTVIYSLRTNLLQYSFEKLDNKTAAWLHALVLGDKSLLDDDVIDVFQRWGLSHILAISGLHIGIVVGLVYILFIRFSITTKEKAQNIVLLFLPIYAILAGSQPSVWRASLMIMLVIIFNKIKLKYSYTDIVSIIFLLLIILNKLIVYHIGFQLSFAVTFGLLLSHQWIRQSNSNVERILQISFVSQMMILPLQINYFFIFQPLSIVLNVIIVPYFSVFVIPFMFVLLLTVKLPTQLLFIFEKVFLVFHETCLQFIFFIDKHMNYPFLIGKIPIEFTILYYIIFIVFMIHLEKGEKNKAFQYGSLVTALIIFLTIRPYFSPVGTVTMLDIGQGDAFIIELPYRKGVFLIDAGATFSFTDFKPTDKVYKQVIRPYLYGQGIHKIDTIFISHNDLDHDGSVPYIIKEFHVEEVIISSFHSITPDMVRELNEAKVKVNRVHFNEKIVRKNHPFHVLSPKIDKKDDNENSLVLYTEFGGVSWLFLGDVGKQTEKEIVKNYPRLSIDVLKVGHHGSNTSTEPSFIHVITPKFAFISVGLHNRYGHPTNEVIETLKNEDIFIYRTDQHGAVQYQYNGKKGKFHSFLKK